MRASILELVAGLPWPLSSGPDADPAGHYTYLLFVPPAFAVAFALVYTISPRVASYAALPTRRRVTAFAGLGVGLGIVFWILLGIAQTIADQVAPR